MTKVEFDFSRLKGKIKEVFNTQEAFAAALGIGEQALSNKLNNRVGWKSDEVYKSCKLMNIPIEEASSFFYVEKARN